MIFESFQKLQIFHYSQRCRGKVKHFKDVHLTHALAPLADITEIVCLFAGEKCTVIINCNLNQNDVCYFFDKEMPFSAVDRVTKRVIYTYVADGNVSRRFFRFKTSIYGKKSFQSETVHSAISNQTFI